MQIVRGSSLSPWYLFLDCVLCWPHTGTEGVLLWVRGVLSFLPKEELLVTHCLWTLQSLSWKGFWDILSPLLRSYMAHFPVFSTPALPQAALGTPKKPQRFLNVPSKSEMASVIITRTWGQAQCPPVSCVGGDKGRGEPKTQAVERKKAHGRQILRCSGN